MSLSCGRAWIEIFCDPMRREIGAPFEVPAPKCFEKGLGAVGFGAVIIGGASVICVIG